MGVLRMQRRDTRQGDVRKRCAWTNSTWRQFKEQLLPLTPGGALRCTPMHIPKAKSFRDSMIAATAQLHGLTLVTRNLADFSGLDIAMINPWEI